MPRSYFRSRTRLLVALTSNRGRNVHRNLGTGSRSPATWEGTEVTTLVGSSLFYPNSSPHPQQPHICSCKPSACVFIYILFVCKDRVSRCSLASLELTMLTRLDINTEIDLPWPVPQPPRCCWTKPMCHYTCSSFLVFVMVHVLHWTKSRTTWEMGL